MMALTTRLLALVWAGLALPASAGVPGSGIDIELLPEAAVTASPVRLGDIARVHVTDPMTRRALSDMPLGAAPRWGEVQTLDRRDVARRLQRADRSFGVPQWSGAESVRVARPTQWVAADDVCQLAEAEAIAWLGPFGETVGAKAACPAAPWAVPPGRLEFKPHALPEGQRPATRMQLIVDLWVDGKFARSVPVALQVRVMGKAWVARQDLKAQQGLEGDALDMRDAELAGVPAAPVSVDLPRSALRLRRPLLAGQVLTAAHVEAQPLVSRGQTVRLHSQAGAIRLETAAEALQDGGPGQRVLVRVPSNPAPMQAWVIGLNQVELKP